MSLHCHSWRGVGELLGGAQGRGSGAVKSRHQLEVPAFLSTRREGNIYSYSGHD